MYVFMEEDIGVLSKSNRRYIGRHSVFGGRALGKISEDNRQSESERTRHTFEMSSEAAAPSRNPSYYLFTRIGNHDVSQMSDNCKEDFLDEESMTK